MLFSRLRDKIVQEIHTQRITFMTCVKIMLGWPFWLQKNATNGIQCGTLDGE